MRPTCLKFGCPDDRDLRRAFGCDGETDEGYGVTCFRCWPRVSRGMRPRKDCPICGGSDEGIWFRECPARVVTAETRLAHDLYGHYRNNILPGAGGTLDQGAAWLASLRVIDSCYGMYQEMEREESRVKSQSGSGGGRGRR